MKKNRKEEPIKKLGLFLFFSFFLFSHLFWKGAGEEVAAQSPGEWTWMHGDNTPNSPGVFGTQGIASPANKPPALYEPCEWKDNNGNFWLFGGQGGGGFARYAALWKYDVSTNQWTWMKGPSAGNQPGVYGTQGVPSPANYPSARGWAATSWTDASGNLWLFGGYDGGWLNDLWKYNISTNEWTWMKGPSTAGNPGSYGTQGVSNPANLPTSRCETSCSWTDNTGNLWLYGGQDWTVVGYRGDLWKYDISINEWTWVHGANTANPSAVYGTQGLSAPVNTPGGRIVYCSWSDLAGNFWLFGGDPKGARYNDLWKYDIAANEWTWMKGPNTSNDPGDYGTKCVSANSNMPPARFENRARVRDGCGNFWNFGGEIASGEKLNDLWHYNVSTNQWTWVSGDNIPNQAAVYGTMGVSNSANKPGAKRGSVAWIDNNGYIWVFGGINRLGNSYDNDLFRYVPDPSCVPVSAVVTISSNITICSGQSATLTASGSTSYSWLPGGQSTSGIVVSPTTSTTYTVTGSNGCGSNSSTVTVTVSPAPSITTSSSTTICNGQSATLTASGGTNYSWSPGGQSTSSVVISPTASTTYSVTGSNGCGSDSSTVTVTVTPIVAATAGPNSTICAGQSVTFTASGGTTYFWSNGNTNSAITVSPTAASTYSVVVSNNKCSDTASASVVVIPSPVAIAWSNVTITAGGSTTFSASGGGIYSWSPAIGLNCTTCSTVIVTPLLGAGGLVYCVTVTDAKGCTDTACVTITIEPIDCSNSGELYIPNAFSPNGDNENDVLKIYYGNIKCIKTFKLIIYNRWGEKVFQTKNPVAEWDGSYKNKIKNTAVFVYYMEATLISGEEIIRKGNVSLIN